MASIKIKQHDIRDCGAACLASIGNFHQVKIPISKIRQMASTDQRGTNILGILQAAEKMGFLAKGVRGEMDSLEQIPLPAIAHLHLKNDLLHFVVIYKVNKKTIRVMDPGLGDFQDYSLEEFREIWTGVLVLMVPGENFQPLNEKISPFIRFWNLIKPHRWMVSQALISAILYTILGLAMSFYIQKITDHVLVNGNLNLLNLLSLGMVGIIFLQIFYGFQKNRMMLKTGMMIDAHLILGYYQHLMYLPQRFFDTMRVGEITSRISDAIKIRAFINEVSIELVVNILVVIFSFSLMFSFYWKLALFALIILPIYFIIYLLLNRFYKKIERKVMEEAAGLETQLVESISHARTIKEFGVEKLTNQKTETSFIKLIFTLYDSSITSIRTSNFIQLLTSLLTILLFWKGSEYVIQQELSPGELFSFYALIGYFTGPLAVLINSNKSIQNALIAADRLFEIMDLEIEDSIDKIDIEKEDLGNISFKQVSFAYGTRADIFENFSIEFPIGKFSAIVGESGGGKTSIFALIQNLYPIQSGKISLGNFSIEEIDPGKIRKLISIVPQQVNLFSGNILENIALGEPDMNIKKIVEICQKLGISSFAENLPNGYQTEIGENGAMLSGGQKQRIALARAIYRDPEILLLDEATASLDSESEKQIQEFLWNWQKDGKTIICIAHRLSTIKNADTIFVIANGKLMEEGNHQELLNKKGIYFELSGKQLI